MGSDLQRDELRRARAEMHTWREDVEALRKEATFSHAQRWAQLEAEAEAALQLALGRYEVAIMRYREAVEAMSGPASSAPGESPARDPDAELEALKARVVDAQSEDARAEVLAEIERYERDFGAPFVVPARRLYAMCWTPEPPRVSP